VQEINSGNLDPKMIEGALRDDPVMFEILSREFPTYFGVNEQGEYANRKNFKEQQTGGYTFWNDPRSDLRGGLRLGERFSF
jgi:hypothetical protein